MPRDARGAHESGQPQRRIHSCGGAASKRLKKAASARVTRRRPESEALANHPGQAWTSRGRAASSVPSGRWKLRRLGEPDATTDPTHAADTPCHLLRPEQLVLPPGDTAELDDALEGLDSNARVHEGGIGRECLLYPQCYEAVRHGLEVIDFVIPRAGRAAFETCLAAVRYPTKPWGEPRCPAANGYW